MNLLAITQKPNGASFRQRIKVYVPLLQERGCRCEVAVLPAGTWDRRSLFRQARAFDGVLLHRKTLGFWDVRWLRGTQAKVIYDFDDAVMYRDAEPDRPSRHRTQRFRRTAGVADLVIAGNPYLAEHAHRFNPNVEVLPTGLDTEAYAKLANRASDGLVRLVWIGSRSTLKYLEQIGPVLEELGRRMPNVVLRIVCDEFFELQHMRVEKRQWSLEREVADLVTSDIALAPLPDDRFTRGKCGFKILQCAAAGLPVVASPVGVNAQYVRDGVTGFHATDAATWLCVLGSLIADPGKRTSMGRAGRLEVRKFDLAVVGERLGEIISACVRSGNQGRAGTGS